MVKYFRVVISSGGNLLLRSLLEVEVMTEPMTTVDKFKLGEAVAQEINEAATAYTGPRWESTTDGQEKAVRFTVLVPSLQGRGQGELAGGGSTFERIVGMAESYRYTAADGYDVYTPVLGMYHVDLEVENGAYTGRVTVWERSCDYEL